MTESEVIRILNNHCRECKLKFFAHVYRGSRGYILDGFAMTQSYATMKTTGYEVKVSRSDFLRDKKWQEYLPVCNTFYFVSPPGVIEKEDLQDGIGLYHCIDNRLKLVKKAKRTDFDKAALFEVLQYIAINRGLSEREKVNSALSQMNRVIRESARYKKECYRLKDSYCEVRNELYELKRHSKEIAFCE